MAIKKVPGRCVTTAPAGTAQERPLNVTRLGSIVYAPSRLPPGRGLRLSYSRDEARSIRQRQPLPRSGLRIATAEQGSSAAPRQQGVSCGQPPLPSSGSPRRAGRMEEAAQRRKCTGAKGERQAPPLLGRLRPVYEARKNFFRYVARPGQKTRHKGAWSFRFKELTDTAR